MNALKTNFQVREKVSFPVRYDNNQHSIKDSEGRLICDIKSWESAELLKDPQDRLKAIGEKIVKLMNESKANPTKGFNTESHYASAEEIETFEWD